MFPRTVRCSLFVFIRTIIDVSISVILISIIFFTWRFLLRSVTPTFFNLYSGLIFIVIDLLDFFILLSRSFFESTFLLVFISSCIRSIFLSVFLFLLRFFLLYLAVALFLRLRFAVYFLSCCFRVLAFTVLFNLLNVLRSFRFILLCGLLSMSLRRLFIGMTI